MHKTDKKLFIWYKKDISQKKKKLRKKKKGSKKIRCKKRASKPKKWNGSTLHGIESNNH